MSHETNAIDCRRNQAEEEERKTREFVNSAKSAASNIKDFCEAIAEESDDEMIFFHLIEIRKQINGIEF